MNDVTERLRRLTEGRDPAALVGLAASAAWVALVLTAALPSAGNVSLLAERHGADTGRVARLIVASTAASFASFTLLAGWLLAR